MTFEEAHQKAMEVKSLLQPHCERIQIAGSVRRHVKSRPIKDIEIVAIPKLYESLGFIQTGIATVINNWKFVKGELGPKCKYTQRITEDGVKLDIFFANPENWGYILVIRTGSANFSHRVAKRWVQFGYKGEDGYLTRSSKKIAVREEIELFKLLSIPMEYLDPKKREI